MIESLIFLILLVLIFTLGLVISLRSEKRIAFQLIPLYFIVGIVVTTLLVYFTRLLGLPFWITSIISGGIIFWQRNKISILPKFKFKQSALAVIFILFCTLILGWIGFNQGYKNGDLVFFNENTHDGLWHIALQKSLINSVPPENPIFSGEILRGYHYFADLFWAYLSNVSNIPAESIYSVFLPFFLSALFAASALMLFLKLTKDKFLAFAFSAILVLGSGFSFFVPFLFPGGSSNQSSFWLDQPVGYIINPHLLLSFSLVNVLFWMLADGKKKWKLIFGILLASLVAIKVYVFLTFAPLLGLLALFYFWKKKEPDLLISCLITLLIAVVLLLTSKVSNGFPFFWEPGWFIKTMFESSDHLNASWWELQRQTFAAHNNYLHLAVQWIFGFLVFVFGNFGLKILGIFLLPIILLKKNKRQIEIVCLLVGLVFLNFLIPLLFLQKGVVWSSIQFLHFIQLPLCLLILLAIEKWQKNLQYLFVVVILIFGLPTTIQAFSKTLNQQNYISYSNEMLSGIKQLNSVSTNDQIIALGDLKSSSLVPAISGKSVFFADPNMLGILQIDFANSKSFVDQIENGSVCPTSYVLISNSDATQSGELIFQNREVKIVGCL